MQNDNNNKNALLILVNLVNIMISLLSLSEIVNEKSKFQFFFWKRILLSLFSISVTGQKFIFSKFLYKELVNFSGKKN